MPVGSYIDSDGTCTGFVTPDANIGWSIMQLDKENHDGLVYIGDSLGWDEWMDIYFE